MQIRDRIREFRRIPAAQLRPNPRNWRTHPPEQQTALKGLLAEIGYAGALLARELADGTLELIDGHLRAETTPEQMVPVLILDVNEDEANKLLAFWDPLSALAGRDAERAAALAAEIDSVSPPLQALFVNLRGSSSARSRAELPDVEFAPSFQLVVHCDSEAQQRELFDQFSAQGLSCRVLTI